MNAIMIPVEIEQFMVANEDAVEAIPTHVNFLQVLPFDHVFVNGCGLLLFKVHEISSHDSFVLFCEGPELSVLQVYMLQLVLAWESERQKLESILQGHLVLLEAIHVVEIRATSSEAKVILIRPLS